MIIRTPKKTGDFTRISNRLLADRKLSFKGKGLACLLLSKPDDWLPSIKKIAATGTDGEDATTSTLNELIRRGYLRRYRLRRADGVLTGWEWVMIEDAVIGQRLPLKAKNHRAVLAGLRQKKTPEI